jgi:hypothetical protein
MNQKVETGGKIIVFHNILSRKKNGRGLSVFKESYVFLPTKIVYLRSLFFLALFPALPLQLTSLCTVTMNTVRRTAVYIYIAQYVILLQGCANILHVSARPSHHQVHV